MNWNSWYNKYKKIGWDIGDYADWEFKGAVDYVKGYEKIAKEIVSIPAECLGVTILCENDYVSVVSTKNNELIGLIKRSNVNFDIKDYIFVPTKSMYISKIHKEEKNYVTFNIVRKDGCNVTTRVNKKKMLKLLQKLMLKGM